MSRLRDGLRPALVVLTLCGVAVGALMLGVVAAAVVAGCAP